MHWAILGNHSDLGIEAEDTAEIGIEFENKIIGSIHLNYTQIPKKHTLEIVGTTGTIFWDYYQDSVLVHRLNDSREMFSEIFKSPEGFDRNDLFIDEMKNFIEVMKNKAEPACSLQDGIAALKLALEVLEIGKKTI